MKPIPTGKLVPTDNGYDLVLTRTLCAPIEDVWASLTESSRTSRWFGPWEGSAGAGSTIKVQMVHEEGQPWMEMHIDACEAPSRLAVTSVDDHGVWRLEALLSETAGTTELNLVQHIEKADGVGSIGPGWEYYLDMLIASRDGTPTPDFNDYYPAQQGYYDTLLASR
ncbi:SRPBCC family protein [Kibdelosporangium philippinense]|uniref:SRPBCC family protein n=1 Tax=Kibdelosporangium philippinense TaxID=211113 RepID=A0ABS8ZHX5_9PSEU|nr:SRPBCC family protein [Kibdelosporangium philippinense]MCE7007411.1 SRPBCC family protein [Kibdelosporangium philippinense]